MTHEDPVSLLVKAQRERESYEPSLPWRVYFGILGALVWMLKSAILMAAIYLLVRFIKWAWAD